MTNKSFGKYITLKEASRLCPYSAQYLGLRARQGKLKAIKIGRDWMTTKEWLEEYINQVQEWKETQRGYKTNNVSSHTQNQSLLPQKYHSSLPSLMAKSLLSIILFLLFFYSFSFAFEQQGLFPIKDNLLSPSTIFKPLHKEKLYASLSLTSPSTYSIFSDLTQSFSSLARQIVYPKPLSLSSLIGNKPSYTPSHNVSFSDKYLVLEKQLRSLLIQQQIKDQEIEELKQEIENHNKEGIPTKEIIKEVTKDKKHPEQSRRGVSFQPDYDYRKRESNVISPKRSRPSDSGPEKGGITIAVIDMFSYGEHGKLVAETVRDSLPQDLKDKVNILVILQI